MFFISLSHFFVFVALRTCVFHFPQTAGMGTNTGNPGRRTAPNVAPNSNIVAPGPSVVPAPARKKTQSVVPPRDSVVVGGPSVAPACPRRKIQAVSAFKCLFIDFIFCQFSHFS